MPLHIRGRRAVLRLPASATAKITPDELVADLMAPANAPAAAAVAMAPAMPPPNATPDQQDITAEASADVVMRTSQPPGVRAHEHAASAAQTTAPSPRSTASRRSTSRATCRLRSRQGGG